ncbi:MAG: hypothetical protein NTX26_03430 [Candidatus Parcubacteria bacterium]|nr:hypothetical protein [Candidatus Parcubacteria bacterium]
MNSNKVAAFQAISDQLKAVEKIRGLLKKNKSSQVRTMIEQNSIQNISLKWLKEGNEQMPMITSEWETLSQVNSDFNSLTEWSHYATSRNRYLSLLKNVKANLIQLQSEVLSNSYERVVQKNIPNLEKLVTSSDMRQIIYRRWEEVGNCISVAPLSCVVMMGALLEALLLARVNQLDDKSVIFKLKSTPIDPVTKKSRNLSEWTLNNYIAIAHEMRWIRKPARDISTTIMEYRNLIHPEKQLRLGIVLEPQDSRMFFAIFKELSNQIIESA